MEETTNNVPPVSDEAPPQKEDDADGEKAAEESIEALQAEMIKDQQRQIDDLKRQLNRANAHIQPQVGRVPKRKAQAESVYDDEGDEDADEQAEREYSRVSADKLAKEIGQEFAAKYPDLVKDETGRAVAAEAYRELEAVGKIGPDVDPWIAAERVGKLGMERLKEARERKRRLEKLEKKARAKTLVGAKGSGKAASEPKPEEEEESYLKTRGPHQIPRA